MLDKNKKYLCETATVRLTGRISVPPSVAGRIVKNDTNAKYEVELLDGVFAGSKTWVNPTLLTVIEDF